MPSRQARTHDQTPLVLDIDGTLLRTDMLYESLWTALGHAFFRAVLVVLQCFTSPARLKRQLLSIARPEVELFPIREQVLDLALEAMREGRPVHLVSGSDQSLVDALGESLGLEGPHYGSDGSKNLTRRNKAAFLVKAFGKGGYDYAGDSHADLPSWRNARKIIAVDPGGNLGRRIKRMGKPTEIISDSWGMKDIIKELRPHQWVKNTLLFLPLLAAHDITLANVGTALVAALAFSFGASSIYILNDLLDLSLDRQHPSKRHRPIAAGRLPIRAAMAICIGLVVLSMTLAASISLAVAAMTLAYMASSLVYSLWLKRLKWVDVLTLASLFLMRVLTGAVATQIDPPGWLLAFVFAAFFALACVKRMTALARAFRGTGLPGRGYAHEDIHQVKRAALTGVAFTGVFFTAYAFSDDAARLYSAPFVLFAALAAMLAWLLRVIRLAENGQEDYDPVVFVTSDRVGLAIAALSIGLVFLAV